MFIFSDHYIEKKEKNDGKNQEEFRLRLYDKILPEVKHMEYEIIQMDEHTWRIQENMVRCFLLEGEEKTFLIDSGMHVNHADEIAKSITDKPVELINTHGDRDHVGSNGKFDHFYMHTAELYNCKDCDMSKMIPIQDGEILDAGNRPLRVIHIPGHTEGSIALLDIRNRVLYSGDTVQDGDIFLFGIHRNFNAYVLSLKRLLSFMDEFDFICSNHGTIPLPASFLPALYEKAVEVQNGNMEGELFEKFGHPVLRVDANIAAFLLDQKKSL